jgi:anti-sigma-K factor RskA
MQEKEIIQSGLLELYALDALTGKDRAMVEEQLQNSQLLRDEYEAISKAIEQYGKVNSVVPPSGVLEAVKEELGISDATQESQPNEITASQSTNERPLSFYWAIAASVLLLISAGINVVQNRSFKELNNDYLALQSESNQLMAQTATLKESKSELQQYIGEITSPETVQVIMGGTPENEGLLASVFWNKQSNKIILANHDVASLSEEKQYQLWALVDGKPVDLGVFDGVDSVKSMKVLGDQAQAFAVTIEPKGGSISPTLSTMCLYGEVKS